MEARRMVVRSFRDIAVVLLAVPIWNDGVKVV